MQTRILWHRCGTLRLCVPALLLISAAAAAPAADWPHWRGPNRNGVVAESVKFRKNGWPGKPVWQVSTGEGSSSPLVVGGKLYVVGWREGQDTLSCLDAASGKTLWSQSRAAPRFGRKSNGDKGLYSAISSTPEFDIETGLIYTLGIDGNLNCFDTGKAGARVWGFNLYEKYEVPQRAAGLRVCQQSTD